MKKSIEIFIVVDTEEQIKARDLNISCNDETYELEKRTFWIVDSAHENRDNKEETIFYSGGLDFVTPMKYKDFVKLVNENL